MNSVYYEAVDRMQKQNVDPEYVVGWATGFLHSPKREQQRVSDAYDAGYAHGMERNAGAFEPWIRKPA